MSQMKRIFLVGLMVMAGSAVNGLELDYYLPVGTEYDSRIPTPRDFFGFQIGERHLRHDQLVDYLEMVATLSERVSVEEYARSYEDRPLLLLTVTAEENHREIDAIKEQHRALCDPERSAEMAIGDMPAVVWMGYSIHGNEASGSNAVPLVVYHLAAALDPEVEDMLRRMVILVDPSFNPDGLSRFTQWVNMHRGQRAIPDPHHREHVEVWPGGRTNHYWFDLNRDWLLVQHPESRGRIEKFHEWKPNVLTDHHEMGSDQTFFFQPGIPTRNNPLTPERTFELTARIASFHAERLDEIGSLYYSRESFDDFYAGKGSTYPDLNGSVGILFEQASTRGFVKESVHGDFDFPFAVRNQVTASFSTLEAAHTLRPELLAHQRDFYVSALEEAQREKTKAYVFGSPDDPARTFHFLELLRAHQIDVRELARDLEIGDQEFKREWAYIVPVRQPQYRLLTALFETRTSFQDSLFYDVSTWTMPLAFGLPHAELRSLPRSRTMGAPVERPEFPQGRLIGGDRPYAYLFEWKGYYAPRALNRLLREEVKAKVATRPFQAETEEGKKEFDYGTIMVPMGIQEKPADIDSLMGLIVAEDGMEVFALRSGLSADGIDLGSPRFAMLKKPEVLMVVGDGVSSYDAGEVWHLLDQRYDMDLSMVEGEQLGRVDLERYTAVVMVEGGYGGISGSGKRGLKRWLEGGGTLVAMGRGAKWAVEDSLVAGKFKKAEDDSVRVRRAYADLARDRGARVIGGAIFEAHLDRTHPLGYGYRDTTISVFRRGTIFAELAESPYAVPLQYAEEPLLSGYVSQKNEEALAGSAAISVGSAGRGRVITIMDRVNFRAFWYGTNKLFANALFFGAIIDGRSTRSGDAEE
jgi:hypothetical protein